jgi:hypothetical protein
VSELCRICEPDRGFTLLAEIVGPAGHEVLLTLVGDLLGLAVRAETRPSSPAVLTATTRVTPGTARLRSGARARPA